MSRYAIATRERARLCFAGLATVLIAVMLFVAPARAGEWMQVSCMNPDGSAAATEGWSGVSAGTPNVGSITDTLCASGSPLSATESQFTPAPQGASAYLVYQPPSGSTLVGGTVEANLYADGYGSSSQAGYAALYEPALEDSPSDVILQCVAFVGLCNPGSSDVVDFSGPVTLPADRGGDFYAQAGCTAGNPGATCSEGGSHGAWALVALPWAHFLLANDAAPQGSQFGGSALQRNARGTAHVVFTATDAGGPGVYQVTVRIDGKSVWSGTPDTNAGACMAVGTDAATGALMFDAQQPCPATVVVDAPVPTAGLTDGAHDLAVTVTDAAHNSSTVLDQTITTSNPQTTPNPSGRGTIHARFVISWHWNAATTLLRSITVERLPANARLAVRCAGKRCPRLRVLSAPARRASTLLKSLDGRRLGAGDRLLITVTAPRRRAERIQLTIRDNRVPLARLLTR